MDADGVSWWRWHVRGRSRSRWGAEAVLVTRVDEREFARRGALLGVGADVTLASLERAYLQRSFAVIRSGTEEQKAELRAAYEALAAELRGRVAAGGAPQPAPRAADGLGAPTPDAPEAKAAGPGWPPESGGEEAGRGGPFSFDSWRVNLVALPALLGVAWVVNHSPLVWLLRGFHVWMHEFGHATVAWLSGYRALPLPFGWTNVEPEKAGFVYFGVLFLLGVLGWEGWRERKIWPLLIALVLAPLQAWMTWRLPEHRYEAWMAWSGIGGEFALSAAALILFFVRMPEKFRWGGCRYVCAFWGATTLLNAWEFWRRVATFRELVPYGSMIHGDEDGGGDMNILRLHGWRETDITASYGQLGTACWVAAAVVWLIFATRLDRPLGAAVARLWPESWRRGEE